MRIVVYPTIEEAIYLHDLLLREFGGTPGILDKGLLDSALTRPKSGYYNSLSEQAAALLQSLAMNHPFVDGNKRVAFALTDIFLRLNGYKIRVEASSGEHFIEIDLVKNRASLQVITSWLESHMEAAAR